MKMYIIIPLTLLSCASAAITTNKPYLLATVLFFNDDNGHQIVAAGHVPKKVNMIIRHDIRRRISNTTIKVAPLFHRFRDSPVPSETIDFVKAKFAHVYRTELPKWLATKVVHAKRKIMNLRKTEHDDLVDLNMDAKNSDEAMETNSISEGNKNGINSIATVPKTYYMPNTVFYAVETKCKIPKHHSCYLTINNKSYKKIVTKTMKKFKSKQKTFVQKTVYVE